MNSREVSPGAWVANIGDDNPLATRTWPAKAATADSTQSSTPTAEIAITNKGRIICFLPINQVAIAK
jgi:hypothetical protein